MLNKNKKLKYYLLFILITLIFYINPIKVLGLTEEQARKAIVDMTYFIYNYKKNDIVYVNPSEVKFNKVMEGYFTEGNKYGVDCDAFASFILYNAFYATKSSDVFDSFGRVGGNAINGWASHSSYYGDRMYMLRQGETVEAAAKRYDIKSILKPGDMIGVVGYTNSSYSTKADAEKERWSHIMVYVGDGKYIHNRGAGVTLTSLPTMSYGSKVGANFEGGTHGSITILNLKNYSSLPSEIVGKLRYPNGSGKFNYYKPDGSVYTTTVAATSVTVSPTTKTIEVGKTATLTATVLPTNTTNKKVTWTSDNTKVATVNTNGVVTGVKAGTAKITVKTSNGKTAVATITVSSPSNPSSSSVIESVSVIPSSRTVKVGTRLSLLVTITPSDAPNKKVTWTSDNLQVAEVDSYGVVTAKKAGVARITVTTQDGAKKAVSVITVEGSTTSSDSEPTPKPSITKVSVESISIEPLMETIKIGQTLSLTAIISPSNATNKSVKWKSSDTNIATVSSSGVVTGKLKGEVDITVTSVDGNKKAIAHIIVNEQSEITDGSSNNVEVPDNSTNVVEPEEPEQEIEEESSVDDSETSINTTLLILCLASVGVFLLGSIIYFIVKSAKANAV